MKITKHMAVCFGAVYLFFLAVPMLQASTTTMKNNKDALQKVYKLQLPFIENQGQFKNESVRFYAKTFGGTVFVTKDGTLVYDLPKSEKESLFKQKPEQRATNHQKPEPKIQSWLLKEKLIGRTGTIAPEGLIKAETKVNYFRGKDPAKWRKNLSTYNMVDLGEVYDGISLKLKAYAKNVEKLFFVKPNSDPAKILLQIEGLEGDLGLSKDGELVITTSLGKIKFTKPVAYQQKDGQKEFIDVAYKLTGDTYGFTVGSYDHSRELVIDPLLASTYFGGSLEESVTCMGLGGNDTIYIGGTTYSSSYEDFPTMSGIQNGYHNGWAEVFVSRLNGDLSTLQASTYLGGTNYDYACDLIVQSGGGNDIITITGSTSSSDPTDGFPTIPGAFEEDYQGGSYDVFVSRLNQDLDTLLYSTYLGGDDGDYPRCLIPGPDESFYVGGYTYSTSFPTSFGAWDEVRDGIRDGFITQFPNDLSGPLPASTLIGGVTFDTVEALVFGTDGNLYVAGHTESEDFPHPDFSFPPGVEDDMHNFGADVFVARLPSDLTDVESATFIGGEYNDYTNHMIGDANNDLYVTGETYSSDFPAENSFDVSFNGAGDAFLFKINGSTLQLSNAALIGDTDYEIGQRLVFDPNGNLYVAGMTTSLNFPTTEGAYNRDLNLGAHSSNYGDVFLLRVNGDLSQLEVSTLFGGSGWDMVSSLAFSTDRGILFVGGSADESGISPGTDTSDFPVTPGSFQDIFNGGYEDGFVSAFDPDLSEPGDPGLAVSTLSGDTNEDGSVGVDVFLKLHSAPSADVIITATSSNAGEGITLLPPDPIVPRSNVAAEPTVITFTSTNWYQNQTLLIEGVDDDIEDGDQAYEVELAFGSEDAVYNTLAPITISMTNLDDDISGVTVGAISGNTTEDGGTATFTVVLDCEPVGKVDIAVQSTDITEGLLDLPALARNLVTADNTILTFDSSNWDAAQSVTLVGQDDDEQDGDVTYMINVNIDTATTTDTIYNALDIPDVTAINEDNDGGTSTTTTIFDSTTPTTTTTIYDSTSTTTTTVAGSTTTTTDSGNTTTTEESSAESSSSSGPCFIATASHKTQKPTAFNFSDLFSKIKAHLK